MNKDFMPPVSIEEFAAYLDGNLSEDGMKNISSIISYNNNLADITEISDVVDVTKEHYMQDEELLPSEIESMDFDIPLISYETAIEQQSDYDEDNSAFVEEKYNHQLIDENQEDYLYSKTSTIQNNPQIRN